LLFFEDTKVAWLCPNCTKDHEPTSQSKNDEQIVGSGNEDDVGDTVKTLHLITLPPVLTLHLNRTSDHKRTSMVQNMVDNTFGVKISGHVRFEEYLDVEQFMIPRYR
jgi:ubiquitin carboxyl-terminal hydrolase 16/45